MSIKLKLLQTLLLPLILLAALLSLSTGTALANPPGITELNGQKVLTLVGRDPPGVRCNNNIQVAAELSNTYKIPVLLVPVTFAGPGAKAPAVYYGDELIAVDGGNLNGMIDATSLADVLELEGAEQQDQEGRLLQIRTNLDALKEAIRNVQ